MKKPLRFYFRCLLLLGAFLATGKGAFANHIVGVDLNYTWVSASTYKVTLTVFGDCGGTNFNTLSAATPTVCVYNGNTSVTALTLALEAPAAGTEITPVCISSIGQTTCTSPTMSIPGVKKFVYSTTYNVPSASAVWRFVFNGYMGAGSQGAGRATAITNINTGGGAVYVQLIDTLNNTGGLHNSSPNLTVIPTPYYCLNNNDNYNPGALDADGDSLRFSLVAGKVGTGTTSCTVGNTNVTYLSGYSGPNPLHYNAGTFVFDPATGQIQFNPDIAQRSLAVYNVREYRGGVLVGTSQREMSFLVQTCTNTPANGPISNASAGVIDDSTHFHICQNSGAFTFHVKPTEANPANRIKIQSSSLPAGSTFNVTGDSTNAPDGTFSWTSTGTATGTYTFFLYFLDDNCPIAGTNSVAYNVTISPNPVLGGTNTVCGGATTTLSTSVTGGTWSSANTAIATVNASSGVVSGINTTTNPLSTTINYTSAAGCQASRTVSVNPQPTITPAGPTICVGNTVQLSNNLGAGTWSSGTTSVATIGLNTGLAGGGAAGASTITFRLTSTGCQRTTTLTVNAAPGAISGPTTVCEGSTITLSNTVAGGTWSSSNLSFATVTPGPGAGGGVVSGVGAGALTISYTSGTGCVATRSLTVNARPAAITPAGTTSVCIGSTAQLSDATGGGTWSVTPGGVATITGGGLLSGAGAGTANVTYTLSGTGCFSTKAITVNTAPTAIIPASPVVCTGFTTALSDAISGGVWSVANTSFATVSPTGVVSGIAVGTTTVTYSVGTCFVIAPLTVNLSPNAGTISGPSSTCVGGTPFALSDNIAGGTWSSGNNTVATITAGGVVTGVSTGTAVISYAVTTSCGTVYATYPVTVSSTVGAGVISGPAAVCAGTFTTLTSTVPGGVWSASNTNVTITNTGLVTGYTPGAVTISYTVTNTCGTYIATKPMTVGAFLTAGTISGPNTVCAGSNITLSDNIAGGVWSSTNTVVATISGLGVVRGVATGTTVISYLMISSCGSTATTYTVTVNPVPAAGSIIGPSTICAGTFTVLSDATTGGVWSSTNIAAATITSGGLLTGVAGGTTTISYTSSNSCGIVAATLLVNVTATASAGVITGPSTVCIGSPVTYTSGAAGGVWGMSNPRASITSGGLVSGITVGADTILYSVTNSCGTATASKAIIINPGLSAGTITGPSAVCVSSLVTLSSSVSGGAWGASNGNATVTTGGVVTGIIPGVDTISYSVIGACGTISSTKVITITPVTGAGTITGPTSVCPGGTITLSDALVGGVWSSSNTAFTTVSPSTGIVSGVAVGTDTIYYTLATSCGTNVSSVVVNVSSTPVIPAIGGSSSVCITSTISLTNSVPGGTWSISGTGATISAGGVVTGISSGNVTVTYTVTNSCGTAFVTKPVAVVTFPAVTLISGPSSVCEGATITLSNGTTGGTWTSTSTANAVVDASTGVVTGVSAGSTIITYLFSNACGTVGTAKPITINPVANPGVITGADSVCVGATITLADAAPGGVWSSGNANATVAGGVVTGVTAGTAPISYTATTSCGSVAAVKIVTILAAPDAGTITGSSSVCVGSGITLANTAPGGTWLSSNSNATFLAPAILNGVTPGLDTIFYLVNNVCGAAVTSKIITVNDIPVVGPVTGPTSQCAGTTITLADVTTGGQWFSSNPAVAAVNITTGDVNGLSNGVVDITYTVTNAFGCPASAMAVDTVFGTVTSPITGSANVCVGASVALTDSIAGGVWNSDNLSIATVDAAGNVYGVNAGTATISYTLTNPCGTSTVTRIQTVDPIPAVAGISGPGSVCVGASITLSDATVGGAWSSSDTTVATVDTLTGVTTGVNAGVANINYTVTNGFGCSAVAVAGMTVNALPVVATIDGVTNICAGAFYTVSDATPGGIWSSSNTAIATIDAAGVVSGVSGGVITITYAVTNGSGCTGLATVTQTINTIPAPTPVTGNLNVCEGAVTTLSNAIAGGFWSTATANATVSPTGDVTGVSAGTGYILYTVTNICGSVIDSALVTVIAAPAVGPISAIYTAICSGTTAALTESATGGTWSTSDATVATVDNNGIVYATSVGTVTITYTASNVSGCTNMATITLTVGTAMPSAAVLPLVSATLCDGNPVYMHVVSSGGGLTYQWYDGASPIPGATTDNYTTGTTGNFFVVINNGGCSVTLSGPAVIAPPNPVIGLDSLNLLYTGTYSSYQWYLNGVIIPGATTGIIPMTGTGYYTVVVTDMNGCSDTSAAFAALAVTSVGQHKDVSIYPNPASTTLHIDAAEKVNISVWSIDGKLLLSQKEAVDLDISALANGMYMITVYDQANNLVKTVRFAKSE